MGMHAICSWYAWSCSFRSSMLQRVEHIEQSISFVGRGGVAPRLRFDESCPLATLAVTNHHHHSTHLVNTLSNQAYFDEKHKPFFMLLKKKSLKIFGKTYVN